MSEVGDDQRLAFVVEVDGYGTHPLVRDVLEILGIRRWGYN